MHYIGMRDSKKRKIDKEGKINISTLNFFYTINWPPSKCIQNLKTLASTGAEKSVT